MLFFKMMSRCLSMHNLVVVVEAVEVEVDQSSMVLVSLLRAVIVVNELVVV
jgi:hypothetical protein